MKITVFGDMMCEPPVLKGAKMKNGEYDFSPMFSKIIPMIEEADYTITNLEFPLAGEKAGYTDRYFAFNAPDSYAQAVKDIGIDLVSTVNNHSLDRGIEGLEETVRTLDRIGLDHTGTFLKEKGREEAFYFEVQGVKFALVAYTYHTNKALTDPDYADCINYLRGKTATYLPEVSKRLVTPVDRLLKKWKEEHRAIVKKMIGLPPTIERADDYMDMEKIEPYMKRFTEDIRAAKEKADFVICLPHVGGQFNPKPGAFSEYVIDQAVKAGADAVLASHSHMVQKAVWCNGVPCAFSLGNFSMSPNSNIIVKENLPEYGLAMHLYFEGAKIEKVTFSILKAVEKKGELLVAWPVDALYATLKNEREKEKLIRDVRQVYGYVTDGEISGEVIQKEYLLS